MERLREAPISDNYYHDYELIGVVSNNGEGLLMLQDPVHDNRRYDIGLHGIELLYLNDFMQGNIVFEIVRFNITEENFDQILGIIKDSKSEYMVDFDKPQYQAAFRRRFVGKKLITMSSSYGARATCICASLSEKLPG